MNIQFKGALRKIFSDKAEAVQSVLCRSGGASQNLTQKKEDNPDDVLYLCHTDHMKHSNPLTCGVCVRCECKLSSFTPKVS